MVARQECGRMVVRQVCVWGGSILASMAVLWLPTCLIKKRLLSETFLESSVSCPTVELDLAHQTSKSRQTGRL